MATENAVKAGVVVVASAGNEGALPYISGAPSVAKAMYGQQAGAIAVGSVLLGHSGMDCRELGT